MAGGDSVTMLTPASLWFSTKRFIQRGRRGWADSDTCNLSTYLEQILAGALVQLANNSHGSPCILEIPDGDIDTREQFTCMGGSEPCMCSHRWSVELYRNAELFNRLQRDEFWNFDEEESVRVEATTWLAKRWGTLWD